MNPAELGSDPDEWRGFAGEPLPGWGCRSMTLFDAEPGKLSDDDRVECGVLSVPFDGTASSRVGAREGPRAIREASLVYSSQLKSRGAMQLRNTRTGALVDIDPRRLVDFGDGHTYASDPARQVRASAAEVRRVASRSELTVLIGGEHTLSFPWYCGVAAALSARGVRRLGYVQIDHPFDFGDRSVLHGPYYHGSNGRRVAEHPAASAVGFVGAGDLTSATQLEGLKRAGVAVRTMQDIRRDGFEASLRAVLDDVAARSDALYVSLDIDVCDAAAAPGTGHVTIGGITAYELFQAPALLRRYPVAAFDLVEVSPRYDPAGVTPHLAARFLYEMLYLRELA
ncbi:MAG: arginase family protein [Kofleriaceae bacterium]